MIKKVNRWRLSDQELINSVAVNISSCKNCFAKLWNFLTYRDVSKKISHLVDPNLLPLEPPPLVDLWDLKILSLDLIIGVDAIGDASDFTVEKWSPGGH